MSGDVLDERRRGGDEEGPERSMASVSQLDDGGVAGRVSIARPVSSPTKLTILCANARPWAFAHTAGHKLGRKLGL